MRKGPLYALTWALLLVVRSNEPFHRHHCRIMDGREDADNVYIRVNDLADGVDNESAFAQQPSLVLSRVMERSSMHDTSQEPVSMKEYLVSCGYQENTRIHNALLKILEDNGADGIMDLGDFTKGFLPWLRSHGTQHTSMELVKLSSFIERTYGEATTLPFSGL